MAYDDGTEVIGNSISLKAASKAKAKANAKAKWEKTIRIRQNTKTSKKNSTKISKTETKYIVLKWEKGD